MLGGGTREASRARTYPAIGVALALGAPLGHLLLRSALDGRFPGPAWIAGEVARAPATYVYLVVSTSIVFAVLGRWLGSKDDRLRRTSITDPLTGLANRRLFDLRLRDELNLGMRYGDPVALLAVDVDGLKRINDVLGHEAGDVALRAVAESLARTVRATDLAARTGGDEFAVIAARTTGEQAVELAERIRATLAHRPPGPFPTPTVSVGVADVRAAGSHRPEDLCAAADRALYAAKSQGRDRVVLAQPTSPKE